MNGETMSMIRDLNVKNATAGTVSALLAITGAPAIILEGAANGQFTTEQTVMWMTSVFFFGGLLSIVVPLYYRLPVAGASSLTGLAFLATLTSQYTYNELLGAYFICACLMLAVGLMRVFSKLMELIPKEIIAAMLAGMITKYIVNFVLAINALPLVGGVALLAYLLSGKWQLRLPPMVAGVVTATVLLFFTQPLSLGSGAFASGVVWPQIQGLEFSLASVVSVSVPLALIVLSNDAAVGLSAVEQNGYRPPFNRLVCLSGIFSMAASLFGGSTSNVAGMMSTICASDDAGPRDKRYLAAAISGILISAFALFAWKLIPLIQALPKEFVAIIAGLSLLGVFSNSLALAFSDPEKKLSAALTFVIAVSNISVLNVSAPVWALAIGTLMARFFSSK